MPVAHPIADQALTLAGPVSAGEGGADAAVQELAQAYDQQSLEGARAVLVKRIYERSDDYQATAALTLVNKALATVGWHDPFSWKHRRKP